MRTAVFPSATISAEESRESANLPLRTEYRSAAPRARNLNTRFSTPSGVVDPLALRRTDGRLSAFRRVDSLEHGGRTHTARRVDDTPHPYDPAVFPRAESRTFSSASLPASPFRHMVGSVFVSRSRKQMIRVHAKRMIAVVAYLPSLGNRPDEQLVARAMRGDHMVAVEREASVSPARPAFLVGLSVETTNPSPARRVDVRRGHGRIGNVLFGEALQGRSVGFAHVVNIANKSSLRNVLHYGELF